MKVLLLRAGAAFAITSIFLLFWFYEEGLRVPRGPLTVDPPPSQVIDVAWKDIDRVFAEDYSVVNRVEEIPANLKNAFSRWTKVPFEMASPGEPIATDVVLEPNPPRHRLVLAASGKKAAILLFETGGWGTWTSVMVADYEHNYIWGNRVASDIRDLPALRKAVANRQFSFGDICRCL